MPKDGQTLLAGFCTCKDPDAVSRRSDFAKNEKYCSKEGQLIEYGQLPRQGERTDLNELKVQLDTGKRPLEIADEVDGMFGVVARHHKFTETYYQYKRQKKLVHDRTVPEVSQSVHPVLEKLNGWMTHMELVTGLQPQTTMDTGSTVVTTMLSFLMMLKLV